MRNRLLRNISPVLLLVVACIAVKSTSAARDPVLPPEVGSAAIGGTVTSGNGPEAGVWVIAETGDAGNRFVKIVVTDEKGRFVLPELEDKSYRVWSRGYGLVDTKPVKVSPGDTVRIKAKQAGNDRQAAEIYPANYWFSLIDVPDADHFPGTGSDGNGISPDMETQQHWLTHAAENCQFCHQLGNKATREVPDTGDAVMFWKQRVYKGRSPDDRFFADDDTYQGRHYGERMSNLLKQFGGDSGAEMFADWSTRINEGEVPEAPPRPEGIERNIVVTLWDMGGGRFIHDTISTDKRNPTVNAGGPVYGTGQFSGMVIALDPDTGENDYFKLTGPDGGYFKHANNHTLTMDAKRRIWMTSTGHLSPMITRESQGKNPQYCTDPDNRFAEYFPRPYNEARVALVFDPATGKSEPLPVCYGTHHLNFDANDRLYFSGDTQVVGWIDTDRWDKTGKVEKAVGWCPFVLDTNGDGKITPDHTQWNLQLDGMNVGEGEGLGYREKTDNAGKEAEFDPGKDTRIAGFNYGMGVSPTDQTYWAARYSPSVPSGILRVEAGANPPETCMTEYYEAPKVNGKYSAYNIRGVDVDENGIAWVAFGSGHLGRFDRSRCEVMNGPSAMGQHCPEGWEIIETPGPKIKGTDAGSDWFYLSFIDHHNTFGLGEGIPILPNSAGDELLAYLPEKKEFVHMRVPYPLGFYPRILDGRIDDKKAGWKGRGLWSGNQLVPIWHQETGEGSTDYAAHFQLRPHPLAE